MQFGLCNASATFQRFIDEVTRGLPGIYAFVDDILIASKNPPEHYPHLKNLFTKLDEYGLCINVSKCIFGASTIDVLGFNLSENGIKPLNGAQLSLWVDASDIAIGGTLSQLAQTKWEPKAFFSMKLNKCQQKWLTYDRELFSIYSAIRKFKHMLEGRNFIIYIDQKSLIYAIKQNPNKCSPRQLRHLDLISQYSTDIRHVQGSENTVADAPSRIEIDSITKSPVLNFR
ncbi:transposon Tf2-6 polyprotein [Trichonephila clavipes]|nr:transposon Tf2-6 polyprotein [Trichonephila clavipes]